MPITNSDAFEAAVLAEPTTAKPLHGSRFVEKLNINPTTKHVHLPKTPTAPHHVIQEPPATPTTWHVMRALIKACFRGTAPPHPSLPIQDDVLVIQLDQRLMEAKAAADKLKDSALKEGDPVQNWRSRSNSGSSTGSSCGSIVEVRKVHPADRTQRSI